MFAPNHECDLLLNSAVLSCWESSYAETQIQAEEETCEDRGSWFVGRRAGFKTRKKKKISIFKKLDSAPHGFLRVELK